jgi:SPP1 gp7 family putative phage head morphogenesis protein
MKKLMKEVRIFMVDLDALGLGQRTTLLTMVREREFEFTTDANKLKAFNEWFKQQVDANVFSVAPGTDPTKPWTAEYVESAYRKGLFNAYMSARDPELGLEEVGGQTSESFMRSAFNQPEVRSKIELLATRSFEQLKGITAQMGSDMNRILAQGMADGSNPRTIAREMQARIGKLTRQRAEVIARTEVIHSHAEGQLDAFDKLGVKELGIMAEWSTAGDDRVCPFCLEREGKIYTVDEARGLIPLHPNCILGDSLVEASDVIALTRVKYSGRIIHISTLRKRHIRVTENHILLTQKGWRFAKDLQQGDELFEASSVHPFFVDDPEKNHGVTTISDTFDALLKILPKHWTRIPRTMPEDFHGDGRAMDQEVDVIFSDCKLWNNFYIPEVTKPEKFLLVRGDIPIKKPLFLNGQSSLSLLLERLAASADSFMSSESIPAILARRSLTHHQLVGPTNITDNDTRKFESISDDTATAFKGFSDLVEALPVGVSLDKVINVEIVESSRGGVFVFDVSSHSSMYSLDGVLSSNCRCAWIPVTKD